VPQSAAQLAKIPDDRYLAEMTRAVFCAGFVWKIIDYKWPGFEEVFRQFDPVFCAYQSDEAIESLLQDVRVVRHYKKLQTTRVNAAFILEVEQSEGSFASFIANWPVADIIGLHRLLKKRGSRLGGRTGQFFLRRIGKDTFVLARDVVGALICQGIVTRDPTSRRDQQAVQDAFNQWQAESGLPLCQISRILSCSVDG